MTDRVKLIMLRRTLKTAIVALDLEAQILNDNGSEVSAFEINGVVDMLKTAIAEYIDTATDAEAQRMAYKDGYNDGWAAFNEMAQANGYYA